MSREISLLGLGADTFFVSAFSPTCLNVHSRFESGLPQAESLISFRRVKCWNVSSSLWFHTLVATAPSVSETASLTVIHFMSRLWSPRGDHNDGWKWARDGVAFVQPRWRQRPYHSRSQSPLMS